MNHSHIAIAACELYARGFKQSNDRQLYDYTMALMEAIPKAVKFSIDYYDLPNEMAISYTPCPFESCYYEFINPISGNHQAMYLRQNENEIIGDLFRTADICLFEPQLFRFILTPDGFTFSIYPQTTHMWTDNELIECLNTSAALVLTANIIMNCKNIVSEVVKPSAKLNRKRIKNKKVPLHEYRTLHISNQRIDYGNDRVGYEGHRKAPKFHMRRGHIRHYKDFDIWVQAATVGNKKQGSVKKEYTLNI